MLPSTPSRTKSGSSPNSNEWNLSRTDTHIEGLLEWVGAVTEVPCNSLDELKDGATLIKLVTCLVKGGQGSIRTLEEAKNTLEELLELKRNSWHTCSSETSQGQMVDVIQLALGYAVQGEQKESAVALIMSLEQDTQHCLMLEVDAALKKCSYLKSMPATPSPFLPEMLKSTRKKYIENAEASGGYQIISPSNENVNSLRSTVKRLARENDAFRAENEQIHANYNALQTEFDSLKKNFAKSKQDQKKDLLRRDEEFDLSFQDQKDSFLSTLQEKDREIAKLSGSLDTLNRKLQQSEGLRDQVEILTSQLQSAEKKDTAIARLKERLNTQADLTQQVEELEEANSVLVEKTSEMSQLSRQLNKVKNELSACKDAYTEAQLELSETRAMLEQREAQLQALGAENEALLSQEKVLVYPPEQSRQDTDDTDSIEKLDDSQDDSAGLGISELNPRIRETLHRLEAENKDLKATLAECSETNLSRLSVENEGLTRLRDKLQSNLREANTKIESLQVNLSESSKRIKELEQELMQRNIAYEEAEIKHAEQYRLLSTESEEKLQSSLGALTQQAEEERKQMTQELECIEKELVDTRAKFEENLRELEVRHLAETSINEILLATIHKSEIKELETAMSLAKEEFQHQQNTLKEIHEKEAGALQKLLEASRKEAEEYQANHVASKEDLEDLETKLQLETDRAKNATLESEKHIERINHLEDEKKRLMSTYKQEMNVRVSKLLETQGALEKEKSRVQKYKLESEDLSFKNNQLRRQIKTVQVQRNQPANRNEDATEQTQQDLVAEIQRLKEENTGLRELNATSSGSSFSMGTGASEMARNFNAQISDLKKKIELLSLSQTEGLLARQEAETKLRKLQRNLKEKEDECTSLRLKFERIKQQSKENTTPNTQATPRSGDKPPQRAAPKTPEPLLDTMRHSSNANSRSRRLTMSSSKSQSRKSRVQEHLDEQSLDDQGNEKCNQQ